MVDPQGVMHHVATTIAEVLLAFQRLGVEPFKGADSYEEAIAYVELQSLLKEYSSARYERMKELAEIEERNHPIEGSKI